MYSSSRWMGRQVIWLCWGKKSALEAQLGLRPLAFRTASALCGPAGHRFCSRGPSLALHDAPSRRHADANSRLDCSHLLLSLRAFIPKAWKLQNCVVEWAAAATLSDAHKHIDFLKLYSTSSHCNRPGKSFGPAMKCAFQRHVSSGFCSVEKFYEATLLSALNIAIHCRKDGDCANDAFIWIPLSRQIGTFKTKLDAFHIESLLSRFSAFEIK